MSTNATVSPAATVNSPTVFRFWPVTRTGVRRHCHVRAGNVRQVPASRVTQGTIAP